MSVRLRAAGVLLILIVASRAEAIPAFARKYGMSCTACHVAWPILNQQGQVFRDNGYQLGLQKDDPSATSSAYAPLAIRTVPAYELTRTTNQQGVDAQGQPATRSNQTGGFGPIGLDVLLGGTFAKDISYLAVLAGFASDEAGAVESAWVRLSNIAGTGWLNLRAGKFELEVPVSGRRGISRLAKHAVHKAQFAGSSVAFRLHDNQAGLELEGHDERSLTRYSLALVSAESDGSRGVFSAPVVYGHATRMFELDSDVLSTVRVGAFGAFGWQPTRFATSDGTTIIPGTGYDHRKYSRVGAELAGTFGSPTTPLYWTAVYMRGQEAASAPDASVATVDNSFDGGYLELIWVPWANVATNATPWQIIGRYDVVRYEKKLADHDFDGVLLGVRRLLAVGPRASAALHFEVHADRTKGAGFDGGAVVTQSALAGVDIAF